MSDDLPPPNTRRWVVRRKAAVVVAVRSGRITLEEALRRWQLSEEEYRSWERAFEAHGLPGLRATRLQQYRRTATTAGTPLSLPGSNTSPTGAHGPDRRDSDIASATDRRNNGPPRSHVGGGQHADARSI
jgi:hypothetical protein